MKQILYSIPTNDYLAKILEANYNLKIERIRLHRISGGSVYYIYTRSNQYVLKTHRSSTANIQHSHAIDYIKSLDIMDYLYSCDFPIAKIIKTKSNKLYMKIPKVEGDDIGAVYEFIHGESPSISNDIDLIATTTSSMHNLMKDYNGELNTLAKDFYIDRFISILTQHYPQKKEIDDLAKYGEYIWSMINNLPTGFCHGDYGDHNMIKSEKKIHIIDFDVASKTFPMYDIALICNATDFWQFDKKDIIKTKENLDKFANIYTKDANLSKVEIDSILLLIAMRQYEVRATVARNVLLMQGSHWLNDNYLKQMHTWIMSFSNYID